MPFEWAIRSAILILAGVLSLKLFRVKDASLALAAWTAILIASLSVPVFTVLVRVPAPVHVPRLTAGNAGELPMLSYQPAAGGIDYGRLLTIAYALAAATLLLRLAAGLAMSHGLKRASRLTDRGFRESDALSAPVVIGIFTPEIILPADWGSWEPAKLKAVLAHERAHIERRDPIVQTLSAIHRAVLWFSPFAWYLHSRLVRLSEQASDDAALAITPDRAFYADLLLNFIRQAGKGDRWEGLAMARYGKAEERIERILNGTVLPKGLTRRGLIAIVLVTSPVAYLIAAAQVRNPVRPQPAAQPMSGGFLGSVKAATVVVKPPIKGQLKSINFREGDMVKQGQLVATVDATEILSPITGLAGFRLVDPGNMVDPGDAIVVIAQVQPIAVVFTAPEDEIPQLRTRVAAGATVEAWNRDNSARIATGKLAGVDNMIDEQTGTAKLKAIFDNRDRALYPNQFVNVRIAVSR